MKRVVDGEFMYPYIYTLQTSLQRPYFGGSNCTQNLQRNFKVLSIMLHPSHKEPT